MHSGLVSVLSVPDGEGKCKSAMEMLSLFLADPQLFKRERLRQNRTAAQWLMARAAQALPTSRFNAIAGSIL
jgi:hypothetical protein